MLPLQPGDVPYTYADVDDLVKDLNYKPYVKEGLRILLIGTESYKL